MNMISEVTFYPIRPNAGLIGFAALLFNNQLSLNCIAVYTTLNGDIRLVFPKKVLPNSKEINVFYPVNTEAYELIRIAVAQKIEELNKSAQKGSHG